MAAHMPWQARSRTKPQSRGRRGRAMRPIETSSTQRRDSCPRVVSVWRIGEGSEERRPRSARLVRAAETFECLRTTDEHGLVERTSAASLIAIEACQRTDCIAAVEKELPDRAVGDMCLSARRMSQLQTSMKEDRARIITLPPRLVGRIEHRPCRLYRFRRDRCLFLRRDGRRARGRCWGRRCWGRR